MSTDAMWLHLDDGAVHNFKATCCKEHKVRVVVSDFYPKKKPGTIERTIDGKPEAEWKTEHAKTKAP